MEETFFFQLNKEELSLRVTMDLVGPSHQALHVQSSSNDSRFVDHAAPSAARRWMTARPRMGTTRRWEDAAVESQIERRRRVITDFAAAWGCSWWRITGGVEGWKDSLAGGGVALRRDAC